MNLFAFGLNHQTTPIGLRERLTTIEPDSWLAGLQEAQGCCFPDEVALISTCNRIEVYGVVNQDQIQEVLSSTLACLADAGQLPQAELQPHLYFHTGMKAAEHLMRVATGLDSLVLGEAQIQGQVRTAMETGHKAGSVGPVLTQLFQRARRAGKRARAETDIGREATSTSHVAVQMAARHLAHCTDPKILVIGAGEMAALAVKTLQMRNFGTIGCLNRTFARAQALMTQPGGRVFQWRELPQALTWADAVITATGASQPVLGRQDICETLPARSDRPLVLIDIALPRNIDTAVGELPGIVRYDIDDLQATLDANFARRQAAVPDVETIIQEELAACDNWLRTRSTIPSVVSLRTHVQQIAEQELSLALDQLSDLNEQEEAAVRKLVHRLTNKILHQPTVYLRDHGQQTAAGTVSDLSISLFGLTDTREEMQVS